MALTEITTAIQALLGSTPVLLGAQNKLENSELPRVVFTPTGDKFGPPESLDQDARQLWTRNSGCSVSIWAADIPGVETLINQIISAIHTAAGAPNYMLDGEAGWLDQQGSLSNQGVGYAFHVAFKVPVTDAPRTTATVTTIPQTNVMSEGDPPEDEDAG